MKIGILTFHFAANYGAVLQAYALQKYLEKKGHDVQIIDFVPGICSITLCKSLITRNPLTIPSKLKLYLKNLRINAFRKKHFRVYPCRYTTSGQLKANPPHLDAYICGSDQIWNKHFVLNAEDGVTLSYFLDFGGDRIRKLSYAASFGDATTCDEYPEVIYPYVSMCLSSFAGVSVREKSAVALLKVLGVNNAFLVPDPTLLLEKFEYEALLPVMSRRKNDVFVYSLHSKQLVMEKCVNVLRARGRQIVVVKHDTPNNIEEWLGYVKASNKIVTNSFHGVVFSIIFRRPFIAVPVMGELAGMNDRIVTLLNDLGLSNRIMAEFNQGQFDDILHTSINWEKVESRLVKLQQKAELFLHKYLF